MFRLRSPGACSLQAVLGKVTQTSYLLFAPFGGTQKYTAAFRAVSCTLCCLRFRALKGKPPSSAHPIARQQKHFGKRRASRPSSYCPLAKAQRRREKPPGLGPSARLQKRSEKEKPPDLHPTARWQKRSEGEKSLPAFILLPACKSTAKKKNLLTFILLPSCKSTSEKRKAFRPSSYCPPAKT